MKRESFKRNFKHENISSIGGGENVLKPTSVATLKNLSDPKAQLYSTLEEYQKKVEKRLDFAYYINDIRDMIDAHYLYCYLIKGLLPFIVEDNINRSYQNNPINLFSQNTVKFKLSMKDNQEKIISPTAIYILDEHQKIFVLGSGKSVSKEELTKIKEEFRQMIKDFVVKLNLGYVLEDTTFVFTASFKEILDAIYEESQRLEYAQEIVEDWQDDYEYNRLIKLRPEPDTPSSLERKKLNIVRTKIKSSSFSL